MRFFLPVLCFLITWCLIDKSDGTTEQRKKSIGQVICDDVCHNACSRLCHSCSQTCEYVCHRVCHRERREVSGSATLPCEFTEWDKNGDGLVNIEEFSFVGFPAMDVRDLILAFQAIDTDGNNGISKTEMHNAEFLLKKC